MSKVDKDQSGAAVRALPSDLTEREEIDLLCQVETYMNVTDKHSQTHPAAGAEEARIYSLVNGLIAKRFSDIGAAVRGEAVPEPKTIGELFASVGGWMNGGELGYPSFGSMEALKIYTQRAIRGALSARAADAPSEPSELLIFSEKGDLMQELENVLMENNWRGDLVERIRESRAADALDSQPTYPRTASTAFHEFMDTPKKDGKSMQDAFNAGARWAFVSSQPTETQPGSPNFDGSAAFEAFQASGGYEVDSRAELARLLAGAEPGDAT